MDIAISEAAVSSRLLSPREQYEKMAEMNPALNLLMSTFDLDLV